MIYRLRESEFNSFEKSDSDFYFVEDRGKYYRGTREITATYPEIVTLAEYDTSAKTTGIYYIIKDNLNIYNGSKLISLTEA